MPIDVMGLTFIAAIFGWLAGYQSGSWRTRERMEEQQKRCRCEGGHP